LVALDPLDLAHSLVAHLGSARGAEIRLVGGLAVRSWVGGLARMSLDVDLVALTMETHARLLEQLRSEGFVVGESGGWWRGLRTGAEGREVVDVASHPVINPRTFDAIVLRAAPRADEQGLFVVGVDDLVYMKLCAGRDQDLLDVCLLAAHQHPDAALIARAARLDDVERLVARTTIEGRFASSRGLLDATFAELLGRTITSLEREAFDELLGQLHEEGL